MKYSEKSFVFFLPLLLIISCSLSKRTSTQSPLDSAIAHYISGDTEVARDELIPLLQMLDGPDLCTAYLYLGRCHLSLGEMEKAAESFKLGSMTCGGELFDEYLVQVRNNLRSSPVILVKSVSITRAQYACLILHYFGSASASGREPTSRPLDIESHWACDTIETVLRNNYMEILPDGSFHPDEPVTRSAFVYQTARLVRLISNDPSLDLDGAFPAGVQEKIEYVAGIAGIDEDTALISGRDAVNLLDNIARKTGFLNGN